MRVAIISDIHANIYGLKTVASDFNKVDKILCAGDITGFYPFVNEVINELKKNDVISVRGNHDQYLIDGKAPDDKREEIKKSVEWMKKLISKGALSYIEALPEYIETTIDNKNVLIAHGSPWDHLEERIYPDYPNFDRFKGLDFDIVILGHTHYPFIRKIGDLTVINPGSCGQPRDNNRLSYTLWDTEKDLFENRRLKWNIDKFKKEALIRGTDENLFEIFKRS
jgi:putative phosphoesterase